MGWHTIPKDDAWKRVTLASVDALGQRLWLRCDGCARNLYTPPMIFAGEHQLDPATPLFSITMRLRCTHCGERKGHCWPEPYSQARRAGEDD